MIGLGRHARGSSLFVLSYDLCLPNLTNLKLNAQDTASYLSFRLVLASVMNLAVLCDRGGGRGMDRIRSLRPVLSVGDGNAVAMAQGAGWLLQCRR